MPKSKSKSMQVVIKGELVKALYELSERDGVPVTEEILRAISDRKYFTDKVRDGNKILLINGAETTRVVFR